MNYVLGYAFNPDMKYVLLIEKHRTSPGLEWQLGKLNGIGGKVLLDTDNNWNSVYCFPALGAMRRECMEETGLHLVWNESPIGNESWLPPISNNVFYHRSIHHMYIYTAQSARIHKDFRYETEEGVVRAYQVRRMLSHCSRELLVPHVQLHLHLCLLALEREEKINFNLTFLEEVNDEITEDYTHTGFSTASAGREHGQPEDQVGGTGEVH